MLLSGGIDSATALAETAKGAHVRALTFEYHGIAASELRAARAIAQWAGVRDHRFVRLPDVREAGDISGAKFLNLSPSYIPMRNAIFYSLAASFAEETRAAALVGGHNRDDAEVFEDVADEFFAALQRALRRGSSTLRRRDLVIERPLRRLRKFEVIRLASKLGVPLDLTWSCHRDGAKHCWDCPGCDSRRDSFMKAETTDPLWDAKGRKIT